MLRHLLLLVLLCLAGPTLAQPATIMTPLAPVRVALTTSAGNIVIQVDRARAPVTAANFLRYVDARRLDGTEFYRAMRTGPAAGLVQGGVRDGRRFDGMEFYRAMATAAGAGLIQGGIRDSRLLYPPIAHEPTS
ncbi:MAG: peptidylprolyl isomerase, partial [Allosphingosinicella sp.]